MKRIALVLLVALVSVLGHAQTALPNLTYNASLNAACATPNAFCASSVFTSNATLGTTGQTGTALDVPSNNYAVATVTVAGTYAGATVNFDFSDPSGGTSYFSVLCSRTDANVIEASEVLPTNGVRSWQCPVAATYRFRVRVSAISSGSLNTWITVSQATIDPSPTVANIPVNIVGSSDPCQNVSVPKLSVPIAISSATTTQLVALSGTTIVYVCGFTAAANAGTNPSFQLEYGTGASCGTGTTTLTGAMASGVTVSATAPGPIFAYGGSDMSIAKTAAGNALCAVTAGTTPNFQGLLTYVQQ